MRFLAILGLCFGWLLAGEMMLLGEYEGQNLNGWVMSEKYDGVRAIWDTKSLKGRKNKAFSPPKWWIEKLPKIALDGELWSGRGEFEKISSIVNSSSDKGWENIKYMVFDSPSGDGDLNARLLLIKSWPKEHSGSPVVLIEQIPIKEPNAAFDFLDEVVRLGGEGVVLRDPNAPYINGRSDKILKLKKAYDSECVVLNSYKGRGKYADMMGGVECEDIKSHTRFKIGSGLAINCAKPASRLALLSPINTVG